VRLERQGQGGSPDIVGQGAAAADQGLVTAMNAIEITDRDRAAF